jgi:hypothetical protein
MLSPIVLTFAVYIWIAPVFVVCKVGAVSPSPQENVQEEAIPSAGVLEFFQPTLPEVEMSTKAVALARLLDRLL